MEVRNRSSVKTNLILRRTVRRTAMGRAAHSTRRKGYLNNLPLVWNVREPAPLPIAEPVPTPPPG